MNKQSLNYKYSIISLLGAIIVGNGFFSKVSAQNISAPDTTDSIAVSVENQEFPQWGYYTVRRDFRRCASPICGGYFIKQVNLKATPCLDGVFRSECYVSAIDWSSLKVSPLELAKIQNDDGSRLLLLGNIVPVTFPLFGEFGNLRVKEAFYAATAAPPKGTFVGLKDNGIRCITTPCFSTNQLVLNKPRVSQVSSIDLSQTGATQKQLEAATSEIFGKGLIAVGTTEVIENADPTNRGTQFVATQFYLRVEPK
ncbi:MULTISPECIES: DUF6748 domain-containing protein [Nostoc]|uniref:DUF6748 domain-containing protein n=1 Tax=Nostoc paludosum FACHB-159 TaxID=2692908 RepID=A0ABR8KLT0_9NOSO|nr:MULTISPECIES: DUF6748 domain-containing protein [Nostoc]MBD2683434.1 hypothetical protein [Nostoc sp. FACHB-857]MBD2739724.1 hypothetical protein [Nostoc paludosum FACHB-159]